MLSNNDGCVIARSAEARKLGVKMGVPAFEIKDLLEKNNVAIFSSNYSLYGDLSQRVMSILAQMSPDIEIYSIDEAFLRIDTITSINPREYAERIKKILMQWLGIPVSVGLGPTKTLAKAASWLAKASPETGGIADLTEVSTIDGHLSAIPVEKVWGIGEQSALFLKKQGIHTACDLKYAGEAMIRAHMHVPGVRTLKELNGISCIPVNGEPPARKAICVSRSYGRPTESYADIEAATAQFVSRVGEKLRNQKLLTSRITVFVMTNRFAKGPRYVNFKTYELPQPTQNTNEINHYMVKALKGIYRKGYLYKKSGILAENLIPDTGAQISLWDQEKIEKCRLLMQAMDRINTRNGRDSVRFALQGFDRKWKMKQEMLSKAYTTRWEDLLIVNV